MLLNAFTSMASGMYRSSSSLEVSDLPSSSGLGPAIEFLYRFRPGAPSTAVLALAPRPGVRSACREIRRLRAEFVADLLGRHSSAQVPPRVQAGIMHSHSPAWLSGRPPGTGFGPLARYRGRCAHAPVRAGCARVIGGTTLTFRMMKLILPNGGG
jgi:hypothetical protein